MTIGLKVNAARWPGIEARLQRGDCAVVPIGAAAKEHGRHLPMDTDYRQVEWLSDRLCRDFPIVMWPVLSYGYYPAFVQYPGSMSLRRDTFENLVADVLDGICRAGAQRIVLLNSGISTIDALNRVSNRDPFRHCTTLVNIYAGDTFELLVAEVSQQAWGGHADEVETSIMLALAPEQVDMTLARPAPRRIRRGEFERFDSASLNYSPDGVNGDPSLATAEKGRRLLDAMYSDVSAVMRELTSR